MGKSQMKSKLEKLDDGDLLGLFGKVRDEFWKRQIKPGELPWHIEIVDGYVPFVVPVGKSYDRNTLEEGDIYFCALSAECKRKRGCPAKPLPRCVLVATSLCYWLSGADSPEMRAARELEVSDGSFEWEITHPTRDAYERIDEHELAIGDGCVDVYVETGRSAGFRPGDHWTDAAADYLTDLLNVCAQATIPPSSEMWRFSEQYRELVARAGVA